MNQFKPASSTEKSFFSEEPMFLYDYKSLQIIDVNSCALDKYGFTKNELLDKKITELGSRISVEADRKSGSDLIDPQSVWNHLKKDGSQFTVQLTTHLFSYEGKPVKLAIAHDIGDKLDQLKNNPYLFPRIETRSGNFPLAIIEWDGELRVREWSGKAKEIFGWGSAEVLNRNLFEIGIIPDSIKDATLENIRKLTGDKLSFFTTESEHLTKDGSTIYCLWHNSAVYDEFGQLMSVYSIVYDISANKEAESKLIESEQRFRVLTEASLVGVYMVQDMMFRYVNPRFCDILGYTEEELLNKKDPMDLIHKDDAKKLMQLREKWFNSEIDSFELDFRAIAKSGRIIEVRVFGSRILIINKAAVIGVVLDQTTQMEAISNFKESVESYRDLFDSIGDAIYIQDETGKFMEVNQGAVEMYGYDKGYFPGKNPADLSAPGKVDLEQTKELFEKALKGEPQRFEWWGKRKNGEIFPKEIRLTPGKYFGQDVVIAVARDVTEQFEQQTELRHNEILFRQLFQNAPIGIAMLDEHKDIHMINHGFEEIFGFKEEEIKGLAIDQVIVPDDKIQEASELSHSKTTFEVSSRRKTKDGSLIDVVIYGVPVLIDGKTKAIYGIYVDITDRKHAEEQVLASLKEKEVLLAEIHHRVKNNLAVITGLLELQSYNTVNDDARRALKDSQFRINSMALIHEKLYQSENLSQISFDVYINELAQFITKSQTPEGKKIGIEVDADPVYVVITQAIPCGLLLNELITNAMKHAFNGKDEGKIHIKFSKDNGTLRLLVEDTGVGLPDKFEEMKTKSLGMTLIRTLSKQLDAEMATQTSKGKGTKFEFTFDYEEA